MDAGITTCRGRIRSPLRWWGGKAALARLIVGLIPPGAPYVEVFGGAAHVLFAKEPGPLDVLNDRDQGLIEFYRVVRDPRQGPELIRRLQWTLYSRAEWRWCRDTWATVTDDPVERARRWFVWMRQSFSGTGRSWSFAVTPQTPVAGTWAGVVADLERVRARLATVQIECLDWRVCLRTYDGPSTVFYCDPPYHPETREPGSRTVYAAEMTAADHAELVDALQRLQGMAVLSGYDHPVYAPLVAAGWQVIRRRVLSAGTAKTRIRGGRGIGAVRADRRRHRVEMVWVHPRLATGTRQAAQLAWHWEEGDAP